MRRRGVVGNVLQCAGGGDAASKAAGAAVIDARWARRDGGVLLLCTVEFGSQVYGIEHAEHVFVGLVIACADNQIRVHVLRQNALDNLALVDRHGPHLEVFLANQNLHWQLGYNGVLQMILAFFGLEFTIIK